MYDTLVLLWNFIKNVTEKEKQQNNFKEESKQITGISNFLYLIVFERS
jgi:hypothetical protein